MNQKINTKKRTRVEEDEIDSSIVRSGTEQEKEPVRRKLPDAAAPYKWKPGVSGNPGGRPVDIVKQIGLRLATKRVGKAMSKKERKLAQDMDIDPDDLSMLEGLMLSLAMSSNPIKNALFLERTFGKVPNININQEISEDLVGRYKSKFTDAELERIGSGESALEILIDKIPDVDEGSIIDLKSEDN